MKYLRFYIFLLTLNTIVSVYSNEEELQSLRLLDNANCTLEHNYYTTFCYNNGTCTNIFTFYPNTNPNSSASIEVIEVGSGTSSFNISLNTSYTFNDSNTELMPFTFFNPPDHPLNKFIEMFVINLTSEISSMNLWDAIDHVFKRCEVALGGIPPYSYSECNINLHCLAYVNCIDSNIGTNVTEKSDYVWSQIADIYSFFTTYIMIIPYVIGLLFSVLNIVLFIQLRSSKNPFMMFIAIQSVYCIFWFLSFFLFTSFDPTFGKSLLGLQFDSLFIGSKSVAVDLSQLGLTLMFLFSFGIEAIRFFKALSRVFALRFPLWSSDKLTIKPALFSCLSTFILGIIAWVFVILTRTFIYTPDGLFLSTVIAICEWRTPLVAQRNVLYIFFGWDCFPQYILFDELFPLNLITFLLDCYVFFLLKRQLSKFNDQQKKRENVLKLFIVMDIIDVSYSCFRKMLILLDLNNYFYSYYFFSYQWSIFYYNAFARYIIHALYATDYYFFYLIRLTFYAIEMVVSQMLMRRIQAIESPHDVPRNFVDRFLLKLTKMFYTRVLRVTPTTIINNSTNIVVAHS